VTVTDASGCSGSRQYVLAVVEQPPAAVPALPDPSRPGAGLAVLLAAAVALSVACASRGDRPAGRGAL
jgi:hypothetical protein